MRPVRGQRKSVAGSNNNIPKKQIKRPEIVPVEGIVQEEEEDGTQVKIQ